MMTSKTRKRFSEKPIVAFTNSTVFVQDFCIYVLVLNAWHLKKAHMSIARNLSPDYKYLHARQIAYQLIFPSQTIPDCIRYIIGVFIGENIYKLCLSLLEEHILLILTP